MSTVLVQTQVAALNVDSYNCNAIYSTANLDNGAVFRRGSLSTVDGEGELFTVVVPTTGNLSNLWMAYSPEIVETRIGGKIYRGLSTDPRDFTNLSSRPFSAFSPQVGDLIQVTDDGFEGGLAGLTDGEFAVAANGKTNLSPSDAVIEGLTFKVLNKADNIRIANGSSLTEAVPCALLECVAIA